MVGYTDEELMTQVAAGRLEGIKLLFERHHHHVYNFIFKMSRDKMLSEDITQDVFYKIIKYRRSYNNGKFVSWLFTIARNSLTSHYKTQAGREVRLERIPPGHPEEQPPVMEEYSQLQLALDRLPASDRELLILHRLQEIKYEDLADILGSTTGAIKTKVSRALKKLKKIYFENN